MIKNVIFDFDGVLAESVHVKTEAFRKLYLPYGTDIADKVVQHHLNNGGVSRFEKFKLYHKKWLGIDLSEAQLQELAQRFSDIVLDDVVGSPEVPGASDFLLAAKDNYRMWIISGTPTAEMKEIAKRRTIDTFFTDIFGSPTDKITWTKHILDNWGIKNKETMFVGDALSDYDAALHHNLHFILRRNEENDEVFKEFTGLEVPDLTQLEQKIKSI